MLTLILAFAFSCFATQDTTPGTIVCEDASGSPATLSISRPFGDGTNTIIHSYFRSCLPTQVGDPSITGPQPSCVDNIGAVECVMPVNEGDAVGDQHIINERWYHRRFEEFPTTISLVYLNGDVIIDILSLQLNYALYEGTDPSNLLFLKGVNGCSTFSNTPGDLVFYQVRS